MLMTFDFLHASTLYCVETPVLYVNVILSLVVSSFMQSNDKSFGIFCLTYYKAKVLYIVRI